MSNGGGIIRLPFPEDIKPYTTFLRPVEIPGVAHDDGDLMCVRFNQTWRSYILGALEILRWSDVWKGDPAEVEATLDQVERMYAAFTEGSCTDMTSIFDVRSDECILEVQRVEGGQWEQIGDFSECGAEGPVGPPGPPGPVGPPGDPCDCSVCSGVFSGVGPTEEVILADAVNVCGFAAGMAEWIHGEFEGSLLLAKQLFEAGKSVADIALRLFEAIPIIGSVASAVREFAEFAALITFELLEYAEFDEWHDWLREKMYCFFICRQTVDLETMADFKQFMIDQTIFLPPQGPLLVLIGQPFAGFAVGWHVPDLLVRGAFYATQESIDCIEFECPACANEWNWHATQETGTLGWVQDAAGFMTEAFTWRDSAGGAFLRPELGEVHGVDWPPFETWLDVAGVVDLGGDTPIERFEVDWRCDYGGTQALDVFVKLSGGSWLMIARITGRTGILTHYEVFTGDWTATHIAVQVYNQKPRLRRVAIS